MVDFPWYFSLALDVGGWFEMTAPWLAIAVTLIVFLPAGSSKS